MIQYKLANKRFHYIQTTPRVLGKGTSEANTTSFIGMRRDEARLIFHCYLLSASGDSVTHHNRGTDRRLADMLDVNIRPV